MHRPPVDSEVFERAAPLQVGRAGRLLYVLTLNAPESAPPHRTPVRQPVGAGGFHRQQGKAGHLVLALGAAFEALVRRARCTTAAAGSSRPQSAGSPPAPARPSSGHSHFQGCVRRSTSVFCSNWLRGPPLPAQNHWCCACASFWEFSPRDAFLNCYQPQWATGSFGNEQQPGSGRVSAMRWKKSRVR